MTSLIKTLQIVHDTKPKFGSPCNNCGYCCLTEVCVVGQELTGSDIAPCKLLTEKDGKQYCKLADNEITREVLGIGTGCCAETQSEVMERLNNE